MPKDRPCCKAEYIRPEYREAKLDLTKVRKAVPKRETREKGNE